VYYHANVFNLLCFILTSIQRLQTAFRELWRLNFQKQVEYSLIPQKGKQKEKMHKKKLELESGQDQL